MSDQLNKVIAYYKSTNFDYEHYWSGRKALALHFGYYDSGVTGHEESLIKMNSVVAGLAKISKKDIVLDAGCGYGGTAIWLAENTGCRVTGVTIVPYQVKKAGRHALKSSAAERLNFFEGDFGHTGLDDETFTVVWGQESIVHSDDKQGFIKEAWRLLKPGGRLVIAEYMLRPDPPLTKSEHEVMRPFLEGWMMPELLTPDEYESLFTKAGFKQIWFHDLSKAVEPSLKKCQRNAGLAMPFVGIARKLRLIDTIRKDYTIANYELYNSFRIGLWRYKVIVGVK